ncbi:peptidase C39 family protein [Haliea sp. E17]|uniref:peptidase C39 family protein n=1 Tax=Haliea sp. E17 TaxID=3401576 RepID=UPI003AAF7E03
MLDSIRPARSSDLEALLSLEAASFSGDRLSRRSFRRWLKHEHCVFLVAEDANALLAYVLVILRRGTRLARLYSIAVNPVARGRGLAKALLQQAERTARGNGALYMRLEVATGNTAGIALYEGMGYRPFGLYRDYYDDHGDAIRMEKCIHAYSKAESSRSIPWFPQSTAFTCGPASLMMGLAALDGSYTPDHAEEIQIWREATTIFMTSGHGGCHPLGLALAAARRGYGAEVIVNQVGPLFLEGVRDSNKKRVMTLVHEGFVAEAQTLGVTTSYRGLDQQELIDEFNAGASVLVLISTYRLDRKKAPHWVVLSGSDERCLFLQDPAYEIDLEHESGAESLNALDYQHLPIAREDFAAMSRFGGTRLQAAVILKRKARKSA